MKRLTSQGWETLRTLTAITAAIGTMICLLILAGCTNELTGQDENRGNGQALTLGTVSIEGGNTRAANAVPGVASGHSFRDDEKLHVALTAGSAQSAGTYLYDGNNSSRSSTKTERAYSARERQPHPHRLVGTRLFFLLPCRLRHALRLRNQHRRREHPECLGRQAIYRCRR
ncbi:hypothetical protein NXX09_19335 [Bacteroides uniformis]|nr:hypothetical protein [Bacteroides uniformis]